MSESIIFQAAYGDFNKEVGLNRLIGGYWHIYINRYYYGHVIRDLITDYEEKRNRLL